MSLFSKISRLFGSKIDPKRMPTGMIYAIIGPFDLDKLLSAARAENRELVIMGNRSPAFTADELWLREAAKFWDDRSLVLTVEKHPNRDNPLCLDPLIIVRRDFLLEAGAAIRARTSGELAIALATKAAAKNRKVLFI
jgi:hypothetical protein